MITAAEAGQVHPLLLERRNLADELMAGLEDLDPSFSSWLLAKRHTIRDRLLRALESALASDTGDLAAQGKLAQAILNLDPTHEDAARRLMRARAMVGDTGGALRVYKALWDLLDEDYGMEPAEATQKLVAEIKTGLLEPPAPSPDPPAATAIMPSPLPATRLWLSVQEVAIREVDPAKVHLVLEFRQHLIASLIRFREWQVTDPPAPGTTAETASRIAAHYEVQMVAYQAGSAVQILVTLKELDSNLYIWTESFEVDLESWFLYQRHVVRRIAMGLNVHLSAERLRRFSDRPDIGLGVYDRWLRCQSQVRAFDPRTWSNLGQQFRDIVAEAPEFAPAYTGLADLHNIEHIVHPGVLRSRDNEHLALSHARKAIQLDASSAPAHLCLAWCYIMTKQYDQAAIHTEVAHELNSNDSWTVIAAALQTAFCGQPERASELAKVALDMTLAPSPSHWSYQADIQFLTGDYAGAIVAADQAQTTRALAWRAAALAQLGRRQEAATDAARFIAGVSANWFGTGPPTEAAIVKWFLHAYPISRGQDWERLRDGLDRAGLPTSSAEHHVW